MALVPSEEQQLVVDCCEQFNIKVNSVPGSGKTTTILSIIDKYIFDEKEILVLTYNSRLRKETIAKATQIFSFAPILPEIHTFHSYAQRTWGVICSTDEGMRKIIKKDLPKINDTQYDIVIVDESQDMTELYYRIFEKTITPDTQIIMLGDIRQSIYGFNGADPRYLLLANSLNKASNREYMDLNLSISYRLSKPLADFVNNCVVFENIIQPSPRKLEGYPKPMYIIDDFFHKRRGNDLVECHGVLTVVNMIRDFLASGYSPRDIFILGPSVKAPQLLPNGNIDFSKYPSTSQCLAWSLLQHGLTYDGKPLKIFVPSFDDAAIDDDVVADKIVFCTFHRSKGLERKIVFLLGFDESYEKFYNKNGEPGKCANPLYVAITRSAEHLILLHHFTKAPLSFCDMSTIDSYVTMCENKKLRTDEKGVDSIQKTVFPSDITRHVRNEYIVNTCKLFKSTTVRKIQTEIRLITKQKDDDNAEQVAEINSYFISLLHNIFVSKDKKMLLRNKKDVYGKSFKLDNNIVEAEDFIVECAAKYKREDIKNDNCSIYNVIQKLMQYSTYCCGINNGYLHKFKQIKRFGWMKKDVAISLLTRLDKVLSDNCVYEESISVSKYDELSTPYAEVSIYGRVDIVDHDKKIVWEIKCVDQLKDEHRIQLLIYKYMHMRLNIYTDYKYYLFNIRTGEVIKIEASLSEAINAVHYLIDKKYTPEIIEDDDEFIKKINSVQI